jgi:hypothetical protein
VLLKAKYGEYRPRKETGTSYAKNRHIPQYSQEYNLINIFLTTAYPFLILK